MPIDLLNFVRKWNASTLTERSAAPQHFRDLCEALGVPHPTQEDEIGASYTFEKRVRKAGTGETGFVDVWKRGFFAWEYKSKGENLGKAYKQLNEYHEDLDNPPLLIVCDFVRFEVHTKFENAPTRTFSFTLDDLLKSTDTATSALPPIDVLRLCFGDYNKLRPELVSIPVTRAAAEDFLRLAQRLEIERALRPDPPTKQQTAHFLMRLVFCLFADSVDLLPDHTFRTLVRNHRFSPISFNRALPQLFQAMSQPDSFFGPTNIPYFNGGLFKDDTTIPLDQADLAILYSAAQHDWSHIEPAIFGTLFERSLDAAKRSMIGAHYTSPEDILLLVEPVIMTPLRRRWETVRQQALDALAAEPPLNKDGRLPAALRANRPALAILQQWAAELSSVRILDPACGSGNFLYVALKQLLDLWQQARIFANQHQLALAPEPIPSPTQLYGIEIDFYAHEIASIVVWIGFLQWKRDHAEERGPEPLLQPLTNIQHADAIMRYDSDGKPYEPTWPEAEYIVSNPPFLGGKLLRRELGDTCIDNLFHLYRGRVKAESDLVVYWFEKSRAQMERSQADRVGLLATQAIRGGANRFVLERIQQTGTIFWAWSDRKWMLAGAAVHVSMVAFERSSETSSPQSASLRGTASKPALSEVEWVPKTTSTDLAASAAEEPSRPATTPGAPHLASEMWVSEPATILLLDGQPVPHINADLTSGENTTTARRLRENEDLCFMGTTKVGPFEIDAETACKMLAAPLNPNGRPNSDVVKPWVNALDITRRPRDMFIIDFGTNTTEDQAALYEIPFEYVRHHVKVFRAKNGRETYASRWWIHGEARGDLRRTIAELERYIVTPSVAKHRTFLWIASEVLPDHAVFAFARDDDYFFGVLHSQIHELWARAQGTQLREVESGFRYTPKTTFDTYPFPWPPGTQPSEADSPLVHNLAEAARTLVRLRDNWLNPLDPEGKTLPESDLKKRTLTNLYNQRAKGEATWLDNAHRTLDAAVFAAYGWPSNLTTQEILARLLALNHQRAAAQYPKLGSTRKRAPKTVPPKTSE